MGKNILSPDLLDIIITSGEPPIERPDAGICHLLDRIAPLFA